MERGQQEGAHHASRPWGNRRPDRVRRLSVEQPTSLSGGAGTLKTLWRGGGEPLFSYPIHAAHLRPASLLHCAGRLAFREPAAMRVWGSFGDTLLICRQINSPGASMKVFSRQWSSSLSASQVSSSRLSRGPIPQLAQPRKFAGDDRNSRNKSVQCGLSRWMMMVFKCRTGTASNRQMSIRHDGSSRQARG